MEKENKEFEIGKYIAGISRYIHILLDKEIEEFNIRTGQLQCLKIISDNSGISQYEISKKIKKNKATITREIKKLIENGYIIRKKDTEDKRIYRLYLSKQGEKIVPKICKKMKKVNNEILRTVDKKEKEELSRLAKKVFLGLKK